MYELFVYRFHKEILMQNANNAEIGEFEDMVHDPHNVRQYVRFRTETCHQKRHIGRTLMVC